MYPSIGNNGRIFKWGVIYCRNEINPAAFGNVIALAKYMYFFSAPPMLFH